MAENDLLHALYYMTQPRGGAVLMSAEEAQAVLQLIVDMHDAHAETQKWERYNGIMAALMAIGDAHDDRT